MLWLVLMMSLLREERWFVSSAFLNDASRIEAEFVFVVMVHLRCIQIINEHD